MSNPILKTTPSQACSPDPNESIAISNFLQLRYMRSERDTDFQDALKDILQIDNNGIITASPLRVGLSAETRGLLVVGPSGSGKTSLVKRNLQNIDAVSLTGCGDPSPGNTLYRLVDSDATLKSFALRIAHATSYTQTDAKIRTTDAWDLAVTRLAVSGTTILWIDEAHHLLTPGAGRDPKLALRRLKNLMQGPKAVTLVLTGVPELHQMILNDRETARRFICIHMRPVSGKRQVANLGRYLDLCCEKVGVGSIKDETFLERLLMANNGSLGESVELTLRAIRRAHRRPKRTLLLEDFRRCYELQGRQFDVGPFDGGDWPTLRLELVKRGWAPC